MNLPQILIVDDIAANRIALKRLLGGYNAELVENSSGVEALRSTVILKNLALILLDVQMPGMDGFEVAEILKEEEQTNHIPIIFITAVHRDERNALKGYASGAVDYIPKPINPDILKSKVNIFLNLWKMRVELEQEIERRVDAEKQSYHLAHHDELTNLHNRRALMKLFSGELNRASRSNAEINVLLIDLDGFKAVNDNFGHEAGDVTLIEVALRLRNIIRNYDTLARVGGDEFVILLMDTDGPKMLKKITDDIIQKVSAPIKYNDQLLHIGISIGIAGYPSDGSEINELLKYADQAMYEAKRLGGNQVKHYAPSSSNYCLEMVNS